MDTATDTVVTALTAVLHFIEDLSHNDPVLGGIALVAAALVAVCLVTTLVKTWNGTELPAEPDTTTDPNH